MRVKDLTPIGLAIAAVALWWQGESVDDQRSSFASGTSVYYPRCAAARAAGVAPIYRGEPGYRSGLDADNDGVACEPYPR